MLQTRPASEAQIRRAIHAPPAQATPAGKVLQVERRTHAFGFEEGAMMRLACSVPSVTSVDLWPNAPLP
eukprot:7344746-Alexandrium_andersonii.AAC.1